jgi:hypothetical protein
MRAMAEHIQLSLRERLDDFDHGEIESSLRETFPSSLDTRSLLLTGNFRDSRRTD